jgi:hypothetical protein
MPQYPKSTFERRESLASMFAGIVALVLLAGVFAFLILGWIEGAAAPLAEHLGDPT